MYIYISDEGERLGLGSGLRVKVRVRVDPCSRYRDQASLIGFTPIDDALTIKL